MPKKKIFIGSSLQQFKAERKYIKGYFEDPRTNGEFEVYLCEDSTTGDMLGDTQKNEIDTELRSSVVAIFLVGDGIGSKTEGEFEKAIGMRDRMRVHLLRKKDVGKVEGQKPWDIFRQQYLEPEELYEQYWNTEDELKRVLDRIYSLVAGPRVFPAENLEYDEFIPADQAGRKNSCTWYFERPDVDGVLSDFLRSDGNNTRFFLLTGASTAGKTMAACKSIQKMKDYSVVALNATATIDDVNNLAPPRGQSVFATGKKILLLDDVQDMLFVRDSRQWKDNAFESVLQRLLDIKNEDFHIILTTYKGWIGQQALSKFISCKVHINPLTRSDMKAYWEDLRAHGHFLGQKVRKGNTIGALFVDFDRLKELYTRAISADQTGSYVKQLADAVKTIWMWKYFSRNELGRLRDYLSIIYKWEDKDVEEVIRKMEGLITYKRDEVSSVESFEVEDVVVNEVFEFIPDKSDKSAEVAAVKRLFRYFLESEREECGENNLFKNCVKCQQMTRSLDCGDVVRKELHRLVCEHYSSQRKEEISNIFKLEHEECSPNVVGKEVNWFQIFASNYIRHEPNETNALKIWEKFGGENPVALYALMRRLSDSRHYEDILKKISEDVNGKRNIKKEYFDENTKCEDVLKYGLKMSLCLLPVVTMEQALGVYDVLPDIGESDDPTEDEHDDYSDPFGLNDDSEDESRQEEESTVKYSIPFENRNRTQKYWCKMNRDMCQYLLLKTRTLKEIEDLVKYLMDHNKGAVPEKDEEVLFFYMDIHTWKRWINETESPKERLKLFNKLVKIVVNRGEGVIESPLLQSKRIILNNLLETFDEVIALQCWKKMNDCRDSYSLHVILSKTGDLGTAMGIFRAFMGSDAGGKIRVGETILNDMLKIASTWSGVKECERLYREYKLIGENERISEAYSSEYTQAILHKVMTFKQVKSHLKFHKPEQGHRRIEALVALVEKVPTYSLAKEIIFGDKFDSEWGVNEEELRILRKSVRAVSLVFKAVKQNDAEDARRLFESMMTIQWKDIMGHPDANVLNEVINNKFIYPTYADKSDAVQKAEKAGCKTNTWTKKHLIFYQLKFEKAVDQKINILNEYLKKLDNDDKNLRDFLIGIRMECAFIKDSKSLKSKQKFPVPTDNGWEDKEMTISEYAKKCMSEGLISSYALKQILGNCSNDEELNDWQNMAIQHEVWLYWNHYVGLKKAGVVIKSPYMLVRQYALFKDVCYNMNHVSGYTFEQAENYIEGVSKEWGVSIERTETYWNVVIGTMSKDTSKSRKDRYEKIMDFMSDHKLNFNSERFYSMLHTIYSKESYDELKEGYLAERERVMNLNEIRAAISQIHDIYENADPQNRPKEGDLMQWYVDDYEGWCNAVVSAVNDLDEAESIDALRATANKGLQTLGYRSDKNYRPKYRRDACVGDGRINGEFMFYWIIGWLGNSDKRFQENRLLEAVNYEYYGKQGAANFVKKLDTLPFSYPECVKKEIREILEGASVGKIKGQVS